EGIAGNVLVTGQDADLAACQRTLAGTQAMTVYKPVKDLAPPAARAAVGVAKGNKPAATTTHHRGAKPQPPTGQHVPRMGQDNLLSTVVAGGFHKAESLK